MSFYSKLIHTVYLLMLPLILFVINSLINGQNLQSIQNDALGNPML